MNCNLFIHLPIGGQVAGFQFLAITNKAAIITVVCKCFYFPGVTSKECIARSPDSYRFSFIKNYQTSFQSVVAFYLLPMMYDVLFAPHSHQQFGVLSVCEKKISFFYLP